MSNTPIPVEAFMPEAVSDDQLKECTKLANEQWKLQKEIDETEASLKMLKERHNLIAQNLLPQAMASCNLGSLESKNKEFRVVVNPYYSAKIDETNAKECFEYLEKNGLGAVIKNNIICVFDRESHEEAAAVKQLLRGASVPFTDEQKVHPQTLKALVKEQVEKGAPFPLATFKAHVGSIAVIKKG